jgi:hypothetical protein
VQSQPTVTNIKLIPQNEDPNKHSFNKLVTNADFSKPFSDPTPTSVFGLVDWIVEQDFQTLGKIKNGFRHELPRTVPSRDQSTGFIEIAQRSMNAVRLCPQVRAIQSSSVVVRV